MASECARGSRREFLATLGSITAAGCLGGADDEDAVLWTEHPASTNAVESPSLGPSPSDAESVVVAFEDPSCSSCAEFADSTLPALRDRAIDPGVTSYVWRGSPGVEPWGEQATRALVAVFRRDPAAFWALKERYYAEQESIDADNVVDRTGDFVGDEIDSDRDDVLAAMDGTDGDIVDHIERDEAAATASDIDVVPSFVLFRDAEYVTTAVGYQPFEVFEGALDL